MVMEASPSPQSVGREFVRQYYTLLNKAPAHLHRFYNNYSSFVHGGLDAANRETLPVVGQKQIHNRIQQLNFRDCHAKISQVDAQATLGNGVVVQVTGELSNGGAPMRRFTQTFVLAAQSPKKYYVHNDIFRYQDIVFSDDSGSASGRSEGEEEDAPTSGYFPPAGFPAPPYPPAPSELSPAPAATPAGGAPSAPPVPPAPVPAAAVNGHPPQHDDGTRHLVAAMQASSLSVAGAGAVSGGGVVGVSVERSTEPEGGVGSVSGGGGGDPAPQPEPEPQREATPTPPPPAPAPATTPAPPQGQPQVTGPPPPLEPKTYANLLKSGGGGNNSAPGVTAPAAPCAPAPAAAPAHQPQEPRPPRQPRQSRDAPTHNAESSGGFSSGGGSSGGGGGGSSRRYPDAQQLFLGNLPHGAGEDQLRSLFARFGVVAELRVLSKQAPPGAPRHPNYGFITYETEQAAHDCLNAQPLYFPPDSPDGVKLNVEKKARGREAPRRRVPSSHRHPPGGSGPSAHTHTPGGNPHRHHAHTAPYRR